MKNITNTQKTKNDPIVDKEGVTKSNDKHIDQDFPGFPHAPSQKRNINPVTKEENLTAGLKKDKTNKKNTRS